jgi:hypothetical protein
MKENEYEIDGVWKQIQPNEMEFIDEIATQLTELNFHENTFVPTPVGLLQLPKFTEEAQDFYNERYDEVESLYINLILQIPKQL